MFGRPTITLIQFRATSAASRMEFQSIQREVAPWADLVAVCGIKGEIIPQVTLSDGVILGGSGDLDFDGARLPEDEVRAQTKQVFEMMAPVLDHLFTEDLPTFGICFGHQMLGAFRGSLVYHDSMQSKQKTHTVILQPEGQDHRLCSELPVSFAAQYGHKDVLAHIPDGAILLAHGGEACRISALAYSSHIVSTQFHPELTLADMHERVATISSYLPEGVVVDDVYQDTPYAQTWLHNFARMVAVERVGGRDSVTSY